MSFRHSIVRKAALALIAGTAFLFLSCQTASIDRRMEIPPDRDLFRAARVEIQAGEYEKALIYLKRAAEVHPDHPEMEMIRLYTAQAYYYTQNYSDSIDTSTSWIKDYSGSRIEGEVKTLLGRNYKATGFYSRSFSWFLKARESYVTHDFNDDKLNEINSLVIELINSTPSSYLQEMGNMDQHNIYTPHIHRRSAFLYLEEGMLQNARESAMLFVRSTTDQKMIDEGRELLEIIHQRIGETQQVRRRAIGCLLPLKGPFARHGQELLNGIQLGLDIFNRTTGNEIDLIIINTNGTVEDTLAGIKTLVHDEKVMAILGPLAANPALAAAKTAQQLGVPIITFAQRDGITIEGDMVFRNFVTPAKEVSTLLNKAMNNLGMKKFGIFYPDTAYGNHMMNLFWDRVDEMGGEITAVESYISNETDFAEGIKKMTGLYYPRPDSVTRRMRAERRIKESTQETETAPLYQDQDFMSEEYGEGEFSLDRYAKMISPVEEFREAVEEEIVDDGKPMPFVDFDAVFIPDNHGNVALIAPHFPFHSVFNVPFLGTSLWLSNELIKTAGSYIQGAIFPTGFFIEEDSESVKAFVNDYRENFGSDPGVVAAKGYDTIRLLTEILKDNNVWTRADIQKALFDKEYSNGVTGKISFDETGELEEDPFLITVYGRRLHVLH